MRTGKRLINYGLGIGLVCLASCAPATPLAAPTPNTIAETAQPSPIGRTAVPATPTPPPTTVLDPANVVDFPDAQSISVVRGIEDTLYVVVGQDHSLFVSRSTDGGRAFNDAVLATGDHSAHVLNFERPAIAASSNGQIAIAWLEIPPDYNGGQVWYASSDDGGQTFTPGQLVATDQSGETTMVELALDDQRNPILTWLNGSRLQFARSFDQGLTFTAVKRIGDGSCECCQPRSLALDEQIYVAYRGLETSQEGDIRDIVLAHSGDRGQTFEPLTRVSDTHWYLPACPIAGPSLIANEKNLYVAWMDGRSAPPGTLSRGDVWLARSPDGGQSFLSNVRINSDQNQHHTNPVVGVGPAGQLYIVWEAQDGNSGLLYYTRSEDQGQTFAPAQEIVSSANGARGRPRLAVLAVNSAGQVAVAWIDQLGARLGLWTVSE